MGRRNCHDVVRGFANHNSPARQFSFARLERGRRPRLPAGPHRRRTLREIAEPRLMRSVRRMAIRVGIGSWGDDEYVGLLYPRGLPKPERLRDYSRSLDHVEVNSTYYATPKPAIVRTWSRQTPAGFTFSVKLHRAFSQSPARAAVGGQLKRVLASATPLLANGRLSAFLLVLPPRFGPDRHGLEELDPLVEKLGHHPLAVELRHRDWVAGRRRASTLDFFRERNLVWVAVDMPRIAGSALMPPIDEVTNQRQAYLRLHGRNPRYLSAKSAADRHLYAYPPREVASLARRVRKLADRADDVFVIANNHARDYAPRTALALKALLQV
jgi:uncharacterized protein YecE (DUF72 family)